MLSGAFLFLSLGWLGAWRRQAPSDTRTGRPARGKPHMTVPGENHDRAFSKLLFGIVAR
jgi:hypothetical protein